MLHYLMLNHRMLNHRMLHYRMLHYRKFSEIEGEDLSHKERYDQYHQG